MKSVVAPLPRVKPTRRNPRSSWPSWTDQRWTLAPTPAGVRTMTDAEFRAWQLARVAEADAARKGGASC